MVGVIVMKKVMEQQVKGLAKKVDAIVAKEGVSKSSKMKELFNLGLEVKEIAKVMGVRYNFVYNVVSNMVIVEGIQVENNKRASKKDKIVELLNAGKTTKEIAIELKTNYNYVYKISKEWKMAQESLKEQVAGAQKDMVADK